MFWNYKNIYYLCVVESSTPDTAVSVRPCFFVDYDNNTVKRKIADCKPKG